MRQPWIALLLWACAVAAQADCRGPVLRVADGDTLRVRCDGQETIVRLRGIDAPEWRQAYGQRAKKELSSLVAGREVLLRGDAQDDYGRRVATVFLGDLNVNREMTRRGYAWAYRRYLGDPQLIEDEAAARRERRGLWSAPKPPLEPWRYRQLQPRH